MFLNWNVLASFHFVINNIITCDVCVACKLTKKTCSLVQRESNLFDLIHTNLGDLKQTPSRGCKCYYVTFIDDFSRSTNLFVKA